MKDYEDLEYHMDYINWEDENFNQRLVDESNLLGLRGRRVNDLKISLEFGKGATVTMRHMPYVRIQ